MVKKIRLGNYAGADVSWDTENSPNLHVAAIGSSGSGKTVKIQEIMCNIAAQGQTVVAINSHGVLNKDQILPALRVRYEKYLHDINTHGKGIGIRFFEPVTYPDGDTESIENAISADTDIFCRAFKLGIKQRAALRGAIENAISDGNYAKYGFNSIEDELKGAQDAVSIELAEKLHFLFAHNVFTDGEDIFKKGKINVIHLSRLDVNMQEAVAEVILSHIWRLANADQFKENGIFVFIDECQNLGSGKNDPLPLLISEGRRMGVNLILATQMILQATTNSLQQRITQCALTLFFKPASNRISLTAKMINSGNEAFWAPKLSKLQVGEFVAQGNLSINGRSIAYPLVVDGYIGEKTHVETEEYGECFNEKTVNGVT